VKAIQAAQDALEVAKAQLLAEVETTRDYELDGASSIMTWARRELRLEAGQTKKLTRAASAMTMLPAVAEAAEAGRIGVDHVAVFAYGLKHIGIDTIRDAVEWLLPVAEDHEPSVLRQVVRQLREAVYPDSLDESWTKGMARQDFQVNPVPEGWHVNGFLNTTTGGKLKSVLDALGAPRDADDDRPGAERRVDALDVMLTTILESGLPSDKGIRPHLSILVDANGPSATLAGFGPIGPKLVDYLSCLSDLTPITTGDQSQVLNVGRTRRHANRQQRRAILARQDGVCAAPGCNNTHLEIHHITWWSRGGRTDLDDMIGLCVRCHHLVHRELLNVTAEGNGQISFTTKTGKPLERPTPPRVSYLPRQAARSNRRVLLRT
jgi:hypothetical protein